ncbi:MAG: RNA ligase [Candidatus Nanoarchaeia archaeon]
MQPECIILVGLQGCGKSTFAKENLQKQTNKNYIIISQDELGKKAHFIKFQQSLQNNENIIIDRINHTVAQREKYITLAKERGYSVSIYNLNIPLKDCVKQLLQRDEHPTFSPKNYSQAIRVLNNTLKEYEPPLESECDYLYNPTQYDPYCLDLSKLYSQFIIIGDIHGCYDELQLLLSKPQIKHIYDDPKTAIVCVGDLVDKGPKSKEVLEWFFSSSKHYCVRGNHEFKLMRYLRGNNVELNHGLKETIEQCHFNPQSKLYDKKFANKVLKELESFPFLIKIAQDNYVLHAGINPREHLLRQPKEYLLFARNYNPITHSFNSQYDKYWFEYYDITRPTIYFGHHHQGNIQPQKNIINLDGNCVYGKELIGVIVYTQNQRVMSRSFLRIDALKTYYESLENINHQGIISHLFKLEEDGFVKSSRYKDLILFNYTQKCVYEKYWNSYTMQARGIVFNIKTGNIVARPFGKFFNINENESTQLHKLPNEEFEVFEKIDGVLAIVFFYDNEWILTTRGEFNSLQAQIGQELLQTINLNTLNTQHTYLCEIVDSRCEIMTSHKQSSHLTLIGIIDTQSGQEVSSYDVEKICIHSNFTCVKKIKTFSNIQEIIDDSKHWSANFEGVVIRFSSGLRVKVKSQAYIDALTFKQYSNSKSLLHYLDMNGDYSMAKLEQLDEEIVDTIKNKLQLLSFEYKQIYEQIKKETQIILRKLSITNNPPQTTDFKIVALFLKSNQQSSDITHNAIIIPFLKFQNNKVHEYILNILSNKHNERKLSESETKTK